MKADANSKHAIIYCRVASQKGVAPGGAIVSQEQRCRETLDNERHGNLFTRGLRSLRRRSG